MTVRNNSKTGLFSAMKRTGSLLLAGSLFAAALLAVLTASLEARAQDSFFAYTNPDTNYVVYMNDEYDLLSDEEESKLINEMIPLTEYGNAGFSTVPACTVPFSARRAARSSSSIWDSACCTLRATERSARL